VTAELRANQDSGAMHCQLQVNLGTVMRGTAILQTQALVILAALNSRMAGQVGIQRLSSVSKGLD
jgi:hypothetical protein